MINRTASPAIVATAGDTADAPSVHRWYALGVLVSIYVVASLDRSTVSVVAEALKREFGLSDAQIGALGGLAFSTPYALTVLPMGTLVDRLNRKRLLGLIVAVWSVLTMSCSLATGYTSLMIARMGVGAAEAGSTPASLSLIADSFPVSRRNTAVSIYYSGTAIAQFVVFLLGGWLLMHYNWRVVFLMAGLPGLILALLTFLTIREPVRGGFDAPARPGEPGRSAQLPVAQVVRAISRNVPLLFLIAATTISSGVQYSVLVWMTSFLVRIHHLSIDQAAIWTGIGIGIGQTAGALVIGPIADRFARGEPLRLALVPAISTFVAGVSGLGLVLASSLPLALIFLSILSFACGCFLGPGYALALSLAQPQVRGSTISVTKLLAMLIGSGLIPLYTGAVSDAVGGPNSIAIALTATILLHFVAAALFFMSGYRARQDQRASSALVDAV